MMKRFLESIYQHINRKKVMLILYAIVIFHLIVMLNLLQDNRVDRKAAKRSAFIQKIVNVIYLVEATPVNNRQKAISAINDPDIHVSLTQSPASDLRYKQAAFWNIIHALELDLHNYSLSIQMKNGEWLNIKATFYTRIVLNQLFFLMIELIVFGSIMMALWSIHRFTSPIQKIKLSAESLGIDLEKKPFAVYGPKVVREMSHALNQMQNRILQLVRNRTQLLAAISHDLRTPIMRAQLRTQFIEDSNYKEQLIDDLREMEKMISETLLFASEDLNQEEKKDIDLVSLIGLICDDAVDMGSEVAFHISSHRIKFSGRPIALKRAFTNLINNAIRYAGNAVVILKQNTKNIFIIVEDNGPGIPEADMEKVFEPFYRSEQSRSKESGGVGLGLSVTKEIILGHQGTIKLTNKKTGGLKVVVKF